MTKRGLLQGGEGGEGEESTLSLTSIYALRVHPMRRAPLTFSHFFLSSLPWAHTFAWVPTLTREKIPINRGTLCWVRKRKRALLYLEHTLVQLALSLILTDPTHTFPPFNARLYFFFFFLSFFVQRLL